MVSYRDARALGYCARGCRDWCARNGLDWTRFRREGLTLAEIEASAPLDAMALRVIAHAQEARDGQ